MGTIEMIKYYKMIEKAEQDYPIDERILPLIQLFNEHGSILQRLVRINYHEFQKDLDRLIELKKQINQWTNENLGNTWD